ncbi:hypothetical protein GH714_010891 [Hevea brasiliensis]|uniref:Uncharacterized protein n=1 Tax=Hevea brasiliensis TaxID=3981 RepID=A0A6A6MYC9_HEVBR|nr:hypothetical protein GH714_010891 [Hevea brasiliensis]
MNVIACEGAERIERPETYKQWQVRALRAGFRQLPLNQEIFAEAKEKVNELYHKDFVIDEDNQCDGFYHGFLINEFKIKVLSSLPAIATATVNSTRRKIHLMSMAPDQSYILSGNRFKTVMLEKEKRRGKEMIPDHYFKVSRKAYLN